MGMLEDARQLRAAQERHDAVAREQARAQAAADEQWRADVAACVPEFLTAALELNVAPDLHHEGQDMWLVTVRNAAVHISPDDYGRHERTVAVTRDGSWRLVSHSYSSRRRTHWVDPDTRDLEAGTAHPMTREDIQRDFVDRLNRRY
jgi:hypothetical protein